MKIKKNFIPILQKNLKYNIIKEKRKGMILWN